MEGGRESAKYVDYFWYLKIFRIGPLSFIDKDNKLHRQILG